jgi:hypothetical protein
LWCGLEGSPPKSRRSRPPVPQHGGGRDHLGAVWSRCLEPTTCFPRRRANGRHVHCVAPQCGSCASSRSNRTRTSARSSAQNASTWESSPLNDDSPCREQRIGTPVTWQSDYLARVAVSVAYAYQVGDRSIPAGRCPAAQAAAGTERRAATREGHSSGAFKLTRSNIGH